MPQDIGEEQYSQAFPKKVRKLALDYAIQTRKLEIELYWRRASYFWAFIAATFIGYGAAQQLSGDSRADLSVLVANLGLVFSWAWFCANRGSKQWHENWENHVDFLEDEIVGPLHKMVASRENPKGCLDKLDRFLVGPGKFSVTKINQLVSLFVSVLWIVLLLHSLPPFRREAPVDWFYLLTTGLSLGTVMCFWWKGRTGDSDYRVLMRAREPSILMPKNAPFDSGHRELPSDVSKQSG